MSQVMWGDQTMPTTLDVLCGSYVISEVDQTFLYNLPSSAAVVQLEVPYVL